MLTKAHTKQLLGIGWLLLLLLVSVACLPAGRDVPPPTAIPVQTATVTTVTPVPTETVAAPTATQTATGPAEPATATATSLPTATPTATPVASVPSGVAYVMARVDLNLRGGPGTAYGVVGWMAHGQIARVSGVSSDGAWWQLDCPSSTVATCWVAAGSQYTNPQPDATRIQFAPGTTKATVTGSMAGTDQVHYVFTAAAGQTLSVAIGSADDNVLFHLQGLKDGQIYKHMLSGGSSWQGTGPQAQDYLLALNALGSTGTYTIQLSVTNGTPPATATKVSESPPGGPLYPVVDMESGYLLGGTYNGAWVDATTYATYLQDTERPYTVYTLSGLQGTVTGNPPVTTGGVCTQPVVPFQPAGSRDGAVALVAKWDAAPRVAQRIPEDTAEYVDVVTTLLQEHGIANPEVHIDHIRRIDLEGDGVDEVLISVSHLVAGTSAPPVAAGDYALLLLRKVVDGAVVTIPLALDVYVAANDLAYPYRYDVLGLLDLNGDGSLEIIVKAERYEGYEVTVYEMTAAGPQQVLQAGCVQ
ncbi:MAG: SH3 domain-containing protein [Anaerolineae bacterium]|nr:SH3 domain-containing protein [Anaerolineae bacterium]